MDPNVDNELIGILRNFSINPKTRLQGWQYVLGLSASENGVNHIISSQKYIPFILSYIFKETDEQCIKSAYKCLINISTVQQGVSTIIAIRKDFCEYLLNTLFDKNQTFKCSLLANLSMLEEISMKIISIFQSSKDLLKKLIKVYFSHDAEERSQYDFLTLVFANISRETDGRRLFLEDAVFITKILDSTKPSESESRRLGAAFILRNCCMETDYHDRLLKDIGIFPALALPLMTNKVYDIGDEMGALPPEWQSRCLEEVKSWDPSPSVRQVLIQAFIALCYSENGWRYLKANGLYYVVRDLHSAEDMDVETKDIIHHFVAYLLIKSYTVPECSISFSQDSDMIKELEQEMNKNLPDFVLKE